MEKWQLRSDLAIEAVAQLIDKVDDPSERGVHVQDKDVSGVKVTLIDVDEAGAKEVGKKPGRYVSLDTGAILSGDRQELEAAMDVFGQELMELLRHKGLSQKATCLVIGLGNEHITPDALGPKVVEEIVVTRHLYELTPDDVDTSYREVSALAPGVMGMTGIETYDVIESVVKKTKPDFLVVVDALASRSVSRVNRVIQMTDTGIAPGSGVGNKRKAVNAEALGIPVIAIGVPTVVDAVSITSDTVDMLLDHLSGNPQDKEAVLGEVGRMDEGEKRQIISEVLTKGGYNLMVTPKDIDTEIEDLATLISSGINHALHPSVPFV